MTSNCFNPLDRGNLYLIGSDTRWDFYTLVAFQSPRSGKFVSDLNKGSKMRTNVSFQSLRSGKFVSDNIICDSDGTIEYSAVSIP